MWKIATNGTKKTLLTFYLKRNAMHTTSVLSMCLGFHISLPDFQHEIWEHFDSSPNTVGLPCEWLMNLLIWIFLYCYQTRARERAILKASFGVSTFFRVFFPFFSFSFFFLSLFYAAQHFHRWFWKGAYDCKWSNGCITVCVF